MFDAFDQQCMSRALELAARGLCSTDPNPRVGCVIARDGELLAEGWHQRAGEAHAEPQALAQAGEAARGATAYVTLEPCSHQGRTASCADALVEAGLSRVVGAIADPNPVVNGRGFERLRAAGVQVDTGLAQEQAEDLNAGFFMRMRERRPWVRVKLALSLDGKTALQDGSSQWISGEASRLDVQEWRARSSAVMTGIGTLLADDPSLNVRLDQHPRQPMRVIVDSHWRTPPGARTLALPGRVLIAGCGDFDIPPALRDTQAELLALPRAGERVDLHALVAALAERAVNELQVEAGATLAGALVDARLVDELLIYQAPLLLGGGSREAFAFGPLSMMDQRVELQKIESLALGRDLRLRFRPEYGRT
jgi:diaminohydroxyphosphoribosylaminopyrimidine deaminase/5-amino-6-(5-phosphoribosylamino)uracil reductase